MNQIKRRLIAFAGAAALAASAIPTAYAVYREETDYSGVADWALREVTAMDQLGLIPESLASEDLSENITREQMCSIAVAAYEQVTGTEAPLPTDDPFYDTWEEDVNKAYALGIVRGDGQGAFRPDDSLTRSEFFCFVERYLQATGTQVTPVADLKKFSDAKTLPGYATEAAKVTVGMGIVNGSGGKLDHKRAASSQEALAMFYRARNAAANHSPAKEFTNLADWAAESVLRMDQLGMVPETVKARSMETNITRLEMCKAAMAAYYRLSGWTAADLGTPKQVFKDTNDVDVLNAYALGIVNGKSSTHFDPNAAITRQDFFTISYNLLKALDYWYLEDIIRDLSIYPDGKDVSGYAKQPTIVMLAIGAVQGSNGKLLPRRSISSQEALVVLQRIVNYYADWTETFAAPDLYLGEEVVEEAMKYLGIRYVYGGETPKPGFDCSGYTQYVYDKFGYDLSRRAKTQWNDSDRTIKRSELLPGDIIFFSKTGKAKDISHVGIYIGDGDMIHASSGSRKIVIADLDVSWFKNNYYGAKRIIE